MVNNNPAASTTVKPGAYYKPLNHPNTFAGLQTQAILQKRPTLRVPPHTMAAPSDRQPLNDLPTNTSPRKASGQNPPLEHRPFSYHRELLRSKVSHSKG